jgi:hypothetical protein
MTWRCSATVKDYWTRHGSSHQCEFKAVGAHDGKPYCKTHLKMVTRPEPRMVDVIYFIHQQRTDKTPLWQKILDKFRESEGAAFKTGARAVPEVPHASCAGEAAGSVSPPAEVPGVRSQWPDRGQVDDAP